jgi:hypothetical protein
MSTWKNVVNEINEKNYITLKNSYLRFRGYYKTVHEYVKLLERTGFVKNISADRFDRSWIIPEELTLTECRKLSSLGTNAAWFCFPEHRLEPKIIRW